MDLRELLNISKELDVKFTEGKELKKEEILNNSLLALMVETAELANELKTFKYWMNNKNIDNKKVDEEFADVLLVTFSIANQLGYNSYMLEDIFWDKYKKNLNRIKEGY